MGFSRWFQWLFRNPHRFSPAIAAGRMSPAIIRKLCPADIDTCCEIYLRNEQEHFPEGHFEDFKKNLTMDSSLWLVIEVEKRVIGVGGICLESADNTTCNLSFGMIHPDYQRQGFGSALLLARLAALPKPEQPIFVCMAPVRNSVKYYERFGFEFLARVQLGKDQHKTDVFTSVLEAAAWDACASLLFASKIETRFDQFPVPVRASGT
jgi:N-acetylglutamate synthase-like GNAT family acetyltransferase